MPDTIQCNLRPECLSLSQTASGWVRAFYPDVTLELEGATVSLSSTVRRSGELAVIWKSALANERLLARGAIARSVVLARLLE